MPIKTQPLNDDGTPRTNGDGSLRPHYDFHDHQGMQDPDVAKHSHVLIKTPDGMDGTVTASDGTVYSIADHYIAVPVVHVDEVLIAIHKSAQALGLTNDEPPAIGPLQAARNAFIAAGWTPPADA